MQGSTGGESVQPVGLRLLVASSDRSYAGALAAALAVSGDIEVIGHAADAGQLATLIDLGPDAVTIAMPLGPSSDWDVIAKSSARSGVLVLGPDEEEVMISAMEAGALGYLAVESSFSEVAEAVRSVAAGTAIVAPPMLGALLRHVVLRRREERKARDSLAILTGRERQVFELVARGFDKQGIARDLFISPETARTHIHNILTKLKLHSQVEIVALAARCGWEIGGRDVR